MYCNDNARTKLIYYKAKYYATMLRDLSKYKYENSHKLYISCTRN